MPLGEPGCPCGSATPIVRTASRACCCRTGRRRWAAAPNGTGRVVVDDAKNNAPRGDGERRDRSSSEDHGTCEDTPSLGASSPEPADLFAVIDAVARIDEITTTLADAAQHAIRTGRVVAVAGWPLVVVPDVVLVEMAANPGGPPPPPSGMALPVGDDGRSVCLWRLNAPVEVPS